MAWLEGLSLGHAMRNAGVWSTGLVNLAHPGRLIPFRFGARARFADAWCRAPRTVDLIARPTVAMATVGFVIAATSGICLVTTNATEYIGNPFLLIKFPAIAIGLVNVVVLNRLPAWTSRGTREPTSRERKQLAVAGAVSLLSWLTAIAAGRMIGYW